jgi:hypothetical protein
MACDEDGGSSLLCFLLCICKVEDLYILDLCCNFDTIAMITIFYTLVRSVIQGVALNTGVLPFSKCRALHMLLIIGALVLFHSLHDYEVTLPAYFLL